MYKKSHPISKKSRSAYPAILPGPILKAQPANLVIMPRGYNSTIIRLEDGEMRLEKGDLR